MAADTGEQIKKDVAGGLVYSSGSDGSLLHRVVMSHGCF